MAPQAPIGALTAGVYYTAIGIADISGLSDGDGVVENYFLQLGAVGLAIGVGFWLIRRYDDRADKAAKLAQELLDAERNRTMALLEQERAQHEKTRQELFDILKEHGFH